ncbi:hypothetical protein PZA11_006841 [Diplocarpon coronariae]
MENSNNNSEERPTGAITRSRRARTQLRASWRGRQQEDDNAPKTFDVVTPLRGSAPPSLPATPQAVVPRTPAVPSAAPSSRRKPEQGLMRNIPYEGCVRSFLAGKSAGVCFNSTVGELPVGALEAWEDYVFLLEENDSDAAVLQGLAATKRKVREELRKARRRETEEVVSSEEPVGQELLPPPIMAPLGLAARLAEAFEAPAAAPVVAPGVAPQAAPRAVPLEESVASRRGRALMLFAELLEVLII